MINFKIQFGYNKLLYTAIVHRMPATGNFPMQYVISEIEPEIENSPPVFFYNPEKGISGLGRHNKLTGKIVKALEAYCNENGIPLKKEQEAKQRLSLFLIPLV